MDRTLRQKIGQLALVSLDSGEIDARAEDFLRAYAVGNVIHFGNNVKDFDSAKALNEQLDRIIQKTCGASPLIGIDHEGGRVMRFGAGFTWFPSQMALGAADDLALTERVGAAMGEELRAAGFHMSYSPVVDVNINPLNPVIGVRAFGDDPEKVTRHGAAMAKGLQSAGVMACLKHFPGHGDTAVDSHYGLPRVEKDRSTLEETELYPYRKLLAERAADAVMTTHILFPALEKDDVPATMSRAILTDLLRRDMGFDGLIVTDGMQMNAIKEHYGVPRGCVEAVKAGADLLCVGTGGAGSMDLQKECLDALYAAAQSGEIPMDRIDDAVSRVLKAKEKYCKQSDMPAPDFAANEALNALVCQKSATALTPLDGALVGRVLCASVPVRELAYGLTHADPRSVSFYHFAGDILKARGVKLDGSPLPDDYDTLLIGATGIKEGCPELMAADQALKSGKRVAFALVGSPYGAHLLPKGCPAVCVYCLTPAAVRAAIDALTGNAQATGKLPVRE